MKSSYTQGVASNIVCVVFGTGCQKVVVVVVSVCAVDFSTTHIAVFCQSVLVVVVGKGIGIAVGAAATSSHLTCQWLEPS